MPGPGSVRRSRPEAGSREAPAVPGHSWVIRPAREGDLTALLELAREAGPGMTNLPPDEALLSGRIGETAMALEQLAAGGRPGSDSILFVLETRAEEAARTRIAGCAGLIPRVGLERPFYSYRRLCLPHISTELHRYETVEALQLVNEYAGDTELGMLYVGARARGGGLGRALSRARMLFIAEHRGAFPDHVIAEMRGVSDASGQCPFWEHLGRHFFDMDFRQADRLSAAGRFQFIADLMPKFPVYLRLLPEEARAVVGVPHRAAAPALALLRREGFRDEGCVDVFDAGPTVGCPTDAIRTVRESGRRVVERVLPGPLEDGARLVLAGSPSGTRIVLAPVSELGIRLALRVG